MEDQFECYYNMSVVMMKYIFFRKMKIVPSRFNFASVQEVYKKDCLYRFLEKYQEQRLLILL